MKKTLIAIVALAVNFFPAAIASGQTLTIKVSDTLLGLNQKWAAAYQSKHPGAVIQVTADGTAAAFAALAGKTVDLVIVSRSMRYKEAKACEAVFSQRPPEFKVAVSGLAVYVNASNSVKVLTYDELAAIFQGQTRNWKELDGGKDQAVSVYAQATNSVNGELFNDEVLNGRGFSAAAHLVAGPDLLKTIAADPAAISFGALVPAEGVQPLSIKRVYSSTPVNPSENNIARRIYPISRYIYSYSNPATKPDAIKAYLDWIRSDEGQQVAKEAGFYALPAILRSNQ
jgi:phosphate transport system substrate-binding protein